MKATLPFAVIKGGLDVIESSIDSLDNQDSVATITGTPPVSPNDGDRALVAAAGTSGAFVGHENEIAEFNGATGTWDFIVPGIGTFLYVDDEDNFYRFAGSTWADSDVTVQQAFTDLTDTPASYSGQAGRLAAVNGGETGIEFIDPSTIVVSDHGGLTGLDGDDHAQYALLAGRTGGQTLQGGIGVGEALTLRGNDAGDSQITAQAPSLQVEDPTTAGAFLNLSTQSGGVLGSNGVHNFELVNNPGATYLQMDDGVAIIAKLDLNIAGLTGSRTWTLPDKEGTIALLSDASDLEIGDAIVGGTANRILFEDGTNQLAEAAGLTWDGLELGVNSVARASGNQLSLTSGAAQVAVFDDGIGPKITLNQNTRIDGKLGINLDPNFDIHLKRDAAEAVLVWLENKDISDGASVGTIIAADAATFQIGVLGSGTTGTLAGIASANAVNVGTPGPAIGPEADNLFIGSQGATPVHLIAADAITFTLPTAGGADLLSGTLRNVDGSAGVPAYTFSSDQTSGIYRAAGLVGIGIGGAARLQAKVGHVELLEGLLVGSSGSLSDGSILAEFVSTSSGVLLPAMTTAQRDAIATPATGITIYNTTTNDIEFFNGSSWVGTAGGGGLSIGDSISGGTAGRILFEDGANQLAEAAELTFDGTTLTAPNTTVVGQGDGTVFLRLDAAATTGEASVQFRRAGVTVAEGWRLINNFAPTGEDTLIAQFGGATQFAVAVNSIRANRAVDILGAGTDGAAVSPSTAARFRYNSTSNKLELSENGGAFVEVSPSDAFAIGDSIAGGGANRILFEDGVNTVAQDADLFFTGTELNFPGARLKEGGVFTLDAGAGIDTTLTPLALSRNDAGNVNFAIKNGGGGTFTLALEDNSAVFGIQMTSAGNITMKGTFDHEGPNVGLYGTTPVVQAAALAALTDSTGGTADGTLAAVGDTSTTDQSGVINDNFAELAASVESLRAMLSATAGIGVHAG